MDTNCQHKSQVMNFQSFFKNYTSFEKTPILRHLTDVHYNTPLILFDRQLKITDCLDSVQTHFPRFLHQLKNGKVSEFFQVARTNEIDSFLELTSQSIKAPTTCPSTPYADQLLGGAKWHHQLPLAALIIARINADFFLGIIKIFHFEKLMPEFTSEIMLLTDTAQTILGYNQNFVNEAKLESTGQLLGRPLESVLKMDFSESTRAVPALLEKVALNERMMIPEPTATIKPLYQNSPDFEISASVSSQCVFFKPPLAADYMNYRIRFKAERLKGYWPGLMLRTEQVMPPDSEGFYFGPGFPKKGFMFKKNGFVLADIALDEKENATSLLIEAEKQSHRYLFKIDNKPVYEWIDRFPFSPSLDHHFAFWIGANSGCRISGLSLEAASCQPKKQTRTTTRILGSMENSFLVHQSLASYRERTCFLYRLEDVSA